MKSPKDIIVFIGKVVLVFGLLYYLYQRRLISVESTKTALMQFDQIVPAFVLMSVTAILAIFRWFLLLNSQEIDMKLGRVFQFGFIGNFFNIALPGVVSGDVIKAIYIGRETEGKRAQALSSILFDRINGVSALVFLSFFALIFSFGEDWQAGLIHAIQAFLIISGGGVVFFYLYLFLLKEHHDPLMIFFRKAEKRWKLFGSFVRIYEGIRVYNRKKGVVFLSSIISLVIHILVVTAFFFFANALGETGFDTVPFFIIIPLGLLVSAIPVMPAGIGTGHAAFAYLFLLLGSEQGANIYSLFVVYQVILGAIGGLIYLGFKSRTVSEN